MDLLQENYYSFAFGLLRSKKVSSRQPLNQFLSIEYFPSFLTLQDKISNFNENSVFRIRENFHIFEKFCLGVNIYKVTSGHPYHTQRVKQDCRNWKKCLFLDTKSALRTFEPPLILIFIHQKTTKKGLKILPIHLMGHMLKCCHENIPFF